MGASETEDWKPYRPPELRPEAAVPEVAAPSAAEGSSDAPESDLWTAIRERADPRARLALFDRFRGFAKGIAATLYGRGNRSEIPFDDFLQLAFIGLLEAMDRYDPARGARFKSFAASRIRGAILNGLARLSEHQQQIATRRRQDAERVTSLLPERGLADGNALLAQLRDVGVRVALGLILEAIGLGEDARDDRDSDPYARVELRQVRQHVKDLVDRLPERERTLIEKHYWKAERFDQIALEMGVTPARISQLHRQAIDRVRGFMANASGCDVAY